MPTRICVFCGSGSGTNPQYPEAARSLARACAARNIGIVYGGASVGLMGTLAAEALLAGGEVIGVIPRFLYEREIAHTGLSELHVVESMHERKALMASLSNGFIALPGGFGTLDEFCEILTWSQLGLQRKPCGLLNTAGYYDHLPAMFDHARDEQFVRSQHRDMVIAEAGIEALLDRLMNRMMNYA